MNRMGWLAAALALCAGGGAAQDWVVEHVKVAHEPGRFGGWPANHGMWNWGNEILVGLSWGYYKDMGERHHIDRDKPEEHVLARSLDGGHTWTMEKPGEKGMLLPRGAALHGVELPGVDLEAYRDCPGGVDFTHPDFAMTFRMDSVDAGTGRWYYTYDRGKTWEGPFKLPAMGTVGMAPRTDYIIDGKHSATVFLTAAKSNGREGRVFCARTTDGGGTWQFLSWIGPEPEVGFAIMPSTVRLSPSKLLTTVRRRADEGSGSAYDRRIDAYVSADNGASWTFLNTPVPDAGEGNPPALLRLADGRLCLTYGVRKAPFRICAKFSSDEGGTWGEEIVLRDDGNDRDIGYCRSVQRPDGKVVTTYYISDPATGPERYIGATVWDPAAIE